MLSVVYNNPRYCLLYGGIKMERRKTKPTMDQIQHHIKTHSERSIDDIEAVTVLKSFLRSNGKIVPDFAEGDKWPNTDGNFELVSNPEVSRRPSQNFAVQIKGTNCATVTEDDIVKYQLQSLAFPAYMLAEVTGNPGILFLVLNPRKKGQERVFWKYISPQFISLIDFNNNSATITFTKEDEIEYTDASVDAFVKKLEKIADNHSYMRQLETRDYSKEDIVKSIVASCRFIEQSIEIGIKENETRDNLSQRILVKLKDLCEGTLILNSIHLYGVGSLRVAWEVALTDIETKFLATFLQGLRYIGIRVPDDGQYERLMLKYYGFLWRIRKYLKDIHGISVLGNLEKFPLEVNDEDQEYNQLIACAIEKIKDANGRIGQNRYYIQKKVPFYVDGERYFEITLQLAGKYATKYNRLTVYSKVDISSNYSIQVGCIETEVLFWEKSSKIKVITDWRVSIEPTALNKLAKIICVEAKITSRHNEYDALMDFLTQTGINFVDLIDFQDDRFADCINLIYTNTKTYNYKVVLETLHKHFNRKSTTFGKNTIRYTMMRLREEMVEAILPENRDVALQANNVYLSKECYAFEKDSILYNLPKSKTNGKTISKDVLRVIGANKAENYLPYMRMKHLIEMTGELYQKKEYVEDLKDNRTITEYNNYLTTYDKGRGFELEEENGYVCLHNYVQNTLQILRSLLSFSMVGNAGQSYLNQKFEKKLEGSNIDETKIRALKKVFVDSQVLMIYGAAGTGKTTLMNYITDLMEGRTKLYLTKTHTALENLQRRIDAPGASSKFMGIDQFINTNSPSKYDVIFVDECSTIDNRTMIRLLEKIDNEALLVFAGDIHQIESIDFGNWFFYAKEVLPEKAIVELNSTWRTQEQALKDLWEEVRFTRPLITEMLVIDGPFSENIGKNLFEKVDDDEVVLCLNYDGKFGLNSINSYFQDANPSEEIFNWYEWKYKVGDKVLFNENKRFPILYNNLKGTIVDICAGVNSLTFIIKIPIVLTAIDVRGLDLQIVSVTEESTQVRFTVSENDESKDEEDYEQARMKSIVPFQLAYAVSIHKAQGLEYKSIKVVIPNSNSERITHGIFYTAITRAKEHLKIYWSSDTMQKVISGLTVQPDERISLDIIKQKLGV